MKIFHISIQRKKFLFLFILLGAVTTGGLCIAARGEWQMAILLYVLATAGFSGGNIFYDSLLPGVASKKKVDSVSSLGFALGYVGGGLLFLVNVIMYLNPGLFGIPDAASAIKLSFLSVAVWWTVFSIPVFLWVKEPEFYESTKITETIILGLRQTCETFREVRRLKTVALFLLAYWLYIDGVDTIIRMSVDYGMSLGFPPGSLIAALLLVQFVAFPVTLFYGRIASKIGVKNTIMAAIFGYVCVTFLGYFMSEIWHFYALAVSIAMFQGGIQALSRSLYARIIPAKKSAQFFGFYNMLGKFASVIGPFLMGTVSLVSGNVRYGILSILILFISGAFFLTKVDIKEGEIMAREHLSA